MQGEIRDPEVAIARASIADMEAILTLQKLAYRSEAALYDDFTIPPLTQTLDQITADLARQVFLKATLEGQIIGSVCGQIEGATCYVGRLVVHPRYQNRGLGTRLLREIEETFREAKRYELFTGTKSERNLHLYGKLGYRACRRQQLSPAVELVFLEKPDRADRDAREACACDDGLGRTIRAGDDRRRQPVKTYQARPDTGLDRQ